MKNNKKNELITDKNKLINTLSKSNYTLDMIRNGIYNIVSSLNYIRELKITKELLDIIEVDIIALSNNINVLVSQLEIKFGSEVKNESQEKK